MRWTVGTGWPLVLRVLRSHATPIGHVSSRSRERTGGPPSPASSSRHGSGDVLKQDMSDRTRAARLTLGNAARSSTEVIFDGAYPPRSNIASDEPKDCHSPKCQALPTHHRQRLIASREMGRDSHDRGREYGTAGIRTLVALGKCGP